MEKDVSLVCSTCGGSLTLNGNVYKCNFCGNSYPVKQELTETDIISLNRAENLRRRFLFDDALEEYELILDNNKNLMEANWGAFLCEYGIEYVKDYDDTFKPTCHRISSYPISKSKYYAVLSDEYKDKAAEIEIVRQKVLKQSKLAPSYDVFLCYKQNDTESTGVTTESGWARDVYEELTYKKGLKVFFAEKSLAEENIDWEAHIYSALRSAKIMFVFGSSIKNIISPWVRNEWKRFHTFYRDDDSRTIRVVYEKFDPYQLPRELQGKQAIDQDRGNWLQLVCDAATSACGGANESKDNVFYEKKYSNPQIAKAMMKLNEGEYNTADQLANQILNDDVSCAKAYIIKLMALYKIKFESLLYQVPTRLFENSLFNQGVQYADEGYKKYLINLANENEKYIIYRIALEQMNNSQYNEARENLYKIQTYKNASNLIEVCNRNIIKSPISNGLGVSRNFISPRNDGSRFEREAFRRKTSQDTAERLYIQQARDRLERTYTKYCLSYLCLLGLVFPGFGWLVAIVGLCLASSFKKRICTPACTYMKMTKKFFWTRLQRYKSRSIGSGTNFYAFIDFCSTELVRLYGDDARLNDMFL